MLKINISLNLHEILLKSSFLVDLIISRVLIPLFLFTLGFNLIGIGPASMILFLTPTSQFILGVFFFNEILTFEKLLGFIIIWLAVIIYLNELRKE